MSEFKQSSYFNILFFTFTSLVLLTIPFSTLGQSYAETKSVQGYATINYTKPSITLHWDNPSNAVKYSIYKRSLGSSSWGDTISTFSPNILSFEDENVVIGQVYEYRIIKSTTTYNGFSYITAAIKKPANHRNGQILLLVSKLISDSLSSEITTLESDLASDGFGVTTQVINASASVDDVKSFVTTAKNGTSSYNFVYLLGDIAVPYAGTYCVDPSLMSPPDGHTPNAPPSHCGAWPSDVFYGSLEGRWTDRESDTSAVRSENKNFPSDGKLDHNISGLVSIAVGRVDFSDLPVFSETEVQLTKRYLDKVHAFKISQTAVNNRGIINDNFSSSFEGFSSSAIRNITAVCGPNSILKGPVFNYTDTADFLFSYSCGPGSYTSCSGLGTSSDFKTKNGAAFNFMLGSYFGDFDNQNNLMRASMASTKLGFGCIWSGRPKWVWHTMALGENYGNITLKSQNNSYDYDGNRYQNGAHMNLLGDPSLRTHYTKPASDLILSSIQQDSSVLLTWTQSSDQDVTGYYIYRSSSLYGPYTLYLDSLIAGNNYIDNTPLGGKTFYMIRAAKETTTGSGSYVNLSLGVTKDITRNYSLVIDNYSVSPTVSKTAVTLKSVSGAASSYTIINSTGITVLSGVTTGNKTVIDITNLTTGVHYILIGSESERFIKN